MRCAVLIAAGLAMASPALAQNQVYDPLPPPGSAYVRFVNTTGGDVALRTDFLPAQTLGTAPAERVTAFQVVEKVAGRALGLDASSGSASGHAVLHADAGSFNTVLLEQGAHGLDAVAVVDHTDFNQSRARLSFYNATPGCAAAGLLLDPDGPAVFTDVAPGSAKARSVNPVTASVHAACTGQAAAHFPLDGMEAGGMYSVWLMQPAQGVTAFLTRDTTAKWKP